MKEQVKDRNIKPDLLRIISAIAVVLLHVSAQYADSLPVNSTDFGIAVAFNSLTRFAVPVFVMISGELFLNTQKTISVKRIWIHNILRLAIVFTLWSFLYYVFQSVYFWHFDFYRQGIVRTVVGIVYATKHLWFLYMIAGLYALTPILREWVQKAEEKNIRYFINLFFIFQIARTTLQVLINKSLTDEISSILTVTELSGYLGYYVLGFYLSKYGVPKRTRTAMYILLPIGIVANAVLSIMLSRIRDIYSPGIYDSFGVFTFFNCVALYLLAESIAAKLKFKTSFVTNLSKDTFGVYLAHIMIWDIVKEEIPDGVFGPVILAIPVFTVIVCIASFALSALIRRIPFIGRYLA